MELSDLYVNENGELMSVYLPCPCSAVVKKHRRKTKEPFLDTVFIA